MEGIEELKKEHSLTNICSKLGIDEEKKGVIWEWAKNFAASHANAPYWTNGLARDCATERYPVKVPSGDIEELTRENLEMQNRIAKIDRDLYVDNKMNGVFNLAFGNGIYFIALEAGRNIINGWISAGVPAPDWQIFSLVLIYAALIIQGLYRLCSDLFDLFNEEINEANRRIITFIRETREARKEYFKKKNAEKNAD